MTPVFRLSPTPYMMVFLCSLLAACSHRIKVDNYPTGLETSLTNMHAYCWADSAGLASPLDTVIAAGGHNKWFDHTIRDTINYSLSIKGYQLSDCSRADFLVDYRMGIHTDVAATDSAETETMNDYGPKWKIGDDNTVEYKGLAKPKEKIVTVQHGTLHVVAFKRDNHSLWHSSAEKTLDDRDSDDQRRENIKQAVEKLMDDFPLRH